MTTKNKTKLNFIEWNNKVLASSIKKISLGIFLIIILDILFYAISGFIVAAWYGQVKARMESTSLPSAESLAALGAQKAQQAVTEARAFMLFLIFSIILLVTAIIFLASIIKGIIWAKTTRTKVTFQLISKFLALNLIWMTFWVALLVLISIIIQQRPLTTISDPKNPGLVFQFTNTHLYVIIIILMSSYFTNTLYSIFMSNKKIGSILEAIKIGISKIHLFLLPYAVILLLLFIFIRLSGMLSFRYSAIVLALMAIAYVAVVRYYCSELAIEIKELS